MDLRRSESRTDKNLVSLMSSAILKKVDENTKATSSKITSNISASVMELNKNQKGNSRLSAKIEEEKHNKNWMQNVEEVSSLSGSDFEKIDGEYNSDFDMLDDSIIEKRAQAKKIRKFNFPEPMFQDIVNVGNLSRVTMLE